MSPNELNNTASEQIHTEQTSGELPRRGVVSDVPYFISGEKVMQRTYRIPLRLWFFMSSIVALLPAAILALPVGFCIVIVALLLPTSIISVLASPGTFLENMLLVPFLPPDYYTDKCGGVLLIPGLTFLGLPYSWFFSTTFLCLLGFSHWNRNTESFT